MADAVQLMQIRPILQTAQQRALSLGGGLGFFFP